MSDESAEGWYTDPFGRHEARWLSAGTPTKLVRDGDVEAYDEPPNEEPSRVPIRIEAEPEQSRGEDLRRADDAERDDSYDPDKVADAISMAFERTRPPR